MISSKHFSHKMSPLFYLIFPKKKSNAIRNNSKGLSERSHAFAIIFPKHYSPTFPFLFYRLSLDLASNETLTLTQINPIQNGEQQSPS